MQLKVSKLWLRRFRLLFCCITKDEDGDEAFLQSAELLSNLFTGTDLVPSGKKLIAYGVIYLRSLIFWGLGLEQ